ncbi:MAG: carbohydrate ABC transporter permease, partial [Burkholderiaceae bacterium]
LLVLVFFIYPAVWILIASFKTSETMFADAGARYTLDNYVSLMQTGFGRNMLNSFYICFVSVAISTVVSTLAAYAFSRMRFRGRDLLFGGVLLGQAFPWIILVTPLFMFFARLGLLNNLLGLMVVYIAVTIPFSIYMLVGYLEGIPTSLDEAALIDGANHFQILWRIVLPLMMPGLVATATYSFLVCWSEYLFALAFLTTTELKTMPLVLQTFFGDNVVEWNHVMAASVLTTLPTLLIFLPAQSLLTTGLGSGAVK